MVEMHFQKNLGIATEEDILIAADAITCLEREHWGIASMDAALVMHTAMNWHLISSEVLSFYCM